MNQNTAQKVQFCQGDMMFVRIDGTNEKGAAERRAMNDSYLLRHEVVNGKIVIQRGEQTGHAHVVDQDKATLVDLFGEEVIVISEPTHITHEQIDGKTKIGEKLHSPLLLEPGAYRVIRQRQQSYPEIEPAPRYKFD